jgi:hypothetical protein
MMPFACEAAEFLRSRGPAVVPLRSCCAAALISAASTGADPVTAPLKSAPFVCAAAGPLDQVAGPPVTVGAGEPAP